MRGEALNAYHLSFPGKLFQFYNMMGQGCQIKNRLTRASFHFRLSIKQKLNRNEKS